MSAALTLLSLAALAASPVAAWLWPDWLLAIALTAFVSLLGALLGGLAWRRLWIRGAERLTVDDNGLHWSRGRRSRRLTWRQITSLRRRTTGTLEMSAGTAATAIPVSIALVGHDALCAMVDRIATAAVERSAPPLDEPIAFDNSARLFKNCALIAVLTGGAAFFSVFWYLLGLPVTWLALRRKAIAVDRITVTGTRLELSAVVGHERIPLRTIHDVRFTVEDTGDPVVIVESSAGTRKLHGLDNLPDIYGAIESARRRVAEGAHPPVYEIVPTAARYARHRLAARATLLALLLLPVANGLALQLAAARGDGAIVEALLWLPVPVNADRPRGETALYAAARAGHVEIVEALIERGADVERGQTDTGLTPLHVAAEYGRTDVVAVLLEAGANPNSRNHWNQTPLWRLSRNDDPRRVECAELLRRAGAEPAAY